MEQISERLANLSQSATLAMAQKSRELQQQGVDIINLSIGEPDFNTPDHIKEAAKKAIDDNYSHYTAVPGLQELREAICDKLKKENNLVYTPDQIVVSTGAKQCICNVLLSVVNKGDEVIVPAPYWVSYIEMVKLAEGTNVIVKAGIDQDFKITPAQLEAAITPKTKAFLFSSPSNPTGSIYTYEELKALAAVFAKHPQIIIISDEIYEVINYTGKHESIAQFSELKDQVVVINGVSKGYAMTGWRLGFTASPLWMAKAINKLQGQYTSGTCAVSQKAAEAAYRGPQQCVADMLAVFHRRRNRVIELAREIKGMRCNEPGGAFYLFPDVSSFFGKSANGFTVKDADDMSLYLLDQGHVATVSGVAFGDDDCIRFSYATSDELLEKAMKRIKDALEALK